MSSLKPGTVVAGRYKIQRMIGEGGMGEVYEALQHGLDRRVALKIIHPAKAKRDTTQGRFLREAKVAASLRHPGIVEIYDFGDDNGTLFLAMEFLQGEALRDWVDEDLPPLPIPRVLEVGAQIADVLVAASGLVHRDLKPENVLFDRTPDGRERVVVVDFGLAFLEDGDDQTGRLTREGAITGTPEYMSPEQARGDAVGPESDVYSLGVMLYEMLANRCPFLGDVATVLSRHLFVVPKPLQEVAPQRGIPSSLAELVHAMMDKDPALRPTAREVLLRLQTMEADGPERMSGRSEDEPRLGRAARMISVQRLSTVPPPRHSNGPRLPLGWLGPVDEDIELGLAANGLLPIELDDEAIPGGVPILFLPEATPEQVERLSKNHQVIADADRGDVSRLSTLLKVGAADVVMRPISADELARKALRLWKRHQRTSGDSN